MFKCVTKTVLILDVIVSHYQYTYIFSPGVRFSNFHDPIFIQHRRCFVRCLTGANWVTPFNFAKPPLCAFCGTTTSSLKHILFSCSKTTDLCLKLRSRIELNYGGICKFFCADKDNTILTINESRTTFLKKYKLSKPPSSIFIFTNGASCGGKSPFGAGAVFQGDLDSD